MLLRTGFTRLWERGSRKKPKYNRINETAPWRIDVFTDLSFRGAAYISPIGEWMRKSKDPLFELRVPILEMRGLGMLGFIRTIEVDGLAGTGYDELREIVD